MNGECKYNLDGEDTNGEIWYRCTTHDELAPSNWAPCAGYKEIPYKAPVFEYETRAEAKIQLKCYNENEPQYAHKIVMVRINKPKVANKFPEFGSGTGGIK